MLKKAITCLVLFIFVFVDLSIDLNLLKSIQVPFLFTRKNLMRLISAFNSVHIAYADTVQPTCVSAANGQAVQFDPQIGYCTTKPLDPYGKCPAPYVYSPDYKTCVSKPLCLGAYMWNPTTKQCEPIQIPPPDPSASGGGGEPQPLEPTSQQPACAVDQNGNGDVEQNEIFACIKTDEGKFICPMGLTQCDPNYKQPSCSLGYTYNPNTQKCEAQPIVGVCSSQQVPVTKYQCPLTNQIYNDPNVCAANCRRGVSCVAVCPPGYVFNSAAVLCEVWPSGGTCPQGGSYNPATGKCEAFVSGYTCPLGSQYTCNCPFIFYDVPCDYWAFQYINWLKNRRITYGCATNWYCPDRSITRAEIITQIIRALYNPTQELGGDLVCQGGVPCSQTTPYFSDVPSSYWAFSFIQKAKEVGITAGYPDGTFKPDNTVPRSIAAIFLIRAYLIKTYGSASSSFDYPSTPYFTDVPASHPQFNFIQKLKQLGITLGCNPPYNTMYCPDRDTTRAESATFLYREFFQPGADSPVFPTCEAQQACVTYNTSVTKWQCSTTGIQYDTQIQCTNNCPTKCPQGGVLNPQTGKCEQPANCTEGTLQQQGCFTGYSCPNKNVPCQQVNGQWMCSPYECVTGTEDEGDIIPSGYEDDGARDDQGNCLGIIYIFNGKSMRCRKSGVQTGFHNCCNKSQGKLYDSTGSFGTVLGAIPDMARIISFVYTWVNVTGKMADVLRQSGSILYAYDAQGRIMFQGVTGWISTSDSLGQTMVGAAQQVGNLPASTQGAFMGQITPENVDQFIGQFSAEWFKKSGVASAIVSLATNVLIDDPVLSAAVNLAAQAALWALGYQSMSLFMIALPVPPAFVTALIQLAIALFTQKCDKQDYMTSTFRESGYCHEVGEYCVKKWPLVGCVQKAISHCCFNSKLARIIHEQGRPQLATFGPDGGWTGIPGDPNFSVKNPNCRGFLPEEFQALDFNKIDLSEYLEDIQRNIRQNVEQQIQETFQKSLEQRGM